MKVVLLARTNESKVSEPNCTARTPQSMKSRLAVEAEIHSEPHASLACNLLVFGHMGTLSSLDDV